MWSIAYFNRILIYGLKISNIEIEKRDEIYDIFAFMMILH